MSIITVLISDFLLLPSFPLEMSTFGGAATIIYNVVNNWYRNSNISTKLHQQLPSEILKFFPFNLEPALVIDFGNDKIKYGFAGDDAPRFVEPSKISHDKQDDQITYIGDEAVPKWRERKAKSPINPMDIDINNLENINWNNIASVYNHLITKLIRPDDTNWDALSYPVLCTEKPNSPSKYRQRLTEIMFEQQNVPSFMLICDAILSLYAAGGRTTGCVLSMGCDNCYSVPIKDLNIYLKQ